MPPAWNHVHVSEREIAHTWPDGQKDDGKWEDCLWCSIVEWLNETYKDIPDTLVYAELLRDASGEPPTGGSNFTDVQRAFVALKIPITLEPKFFPTFWTRLAPGRSGVANGNMGNFPAGHRLRRHDPGFASGHTVEVHRPDTTERVWWCDPLAPKGTYTGEWVTKAELQKFMAPSWTGVVGTVLPKPVPPPAGDDMPPLTTYVPGSTANIKPESNVRAAPKIAATKYRTVPVDKPEPVVLTGTVTGDVDPANNSNVWFVWWKNGRWEYTAKDNIIDIKLPTTQAQVDAAVAAAVATQKAANDAEVAALTGRITGIKAKVAANAADVAND